MNGSWNQIVDRLLNRVTMYRLTLYYVAGLLAVAFVLGFFKLVPNDPTALAFSFVVILAVCWITNRVFAALLRLPANTESVYITAFILALVLPPVTATNDVGVGGLIVAAVVATASKFVFAIRGKHIFNPVAIGISASALILDQPATWWVGGNLTMLPFVLVGGLLVVRKVQRFDMVGVYMLANLAATSPAMFGQALNETLFYSPLFFAGFAMLTEPLTAPQARRPRLIFGALVGMLSSPNIHVGEFYLTPEIAFLIGNAFAYAVAPKGRFKLTLLRIEKAASGCYDFVFKPDRKLVFRAGQYLDWTLDVRNPDDRGNRRPFTIASGPTDHEVRLGVKFNARSSAFKRSLAAMKPGDAIYGSQLAGEFTLPVDQTEKLVFIAGGIGVTPFRSMISDLIERHDRRSVVLLYGNRKIDEIAYSDVFEQAGHQLGLRTIYAVTGDSARGTAAHRGRIDANLIRSEVPDYKDRTFYVSGPRSMVVASKAVLEELGIARKRIKVDFFPGFA